MAELNDQEILIIHLHAALYQRKKSNTVETPAKKLVFGMLNVSDSNEEIPPMNDAPNLFSPVTAASTLSALSFSDFSQRSVSCPKELATAQTLITSLQQARETRNQLWQQLEQLNVEVATEKAQTTPSKPISMRDGNSGQFDGVIPFGIEQ
jgi:hypothetical protein